MGSITRPAVYASTKAKPPASDVNRGIYDEDWTETLPGVYQVEVDGVSHRYEYDIRGHEHFRDGVLIDYGRHAHNKSREPHRHLALGDKRPSKARQSQTVPSGNPPVMPPTHHGHRIYVNQAVELGEAMDAALLAIRKGAAAYEDARWRDAVTAYASAISSLKAGIAAAEKMTQAMSDLESDDNRWRRGTIEYERWNKAA